MKEEPAAPVSTRSNAEDEATARIVGVLNLDGEWALPQIQVNIHAPLPLNAVPNDASASSPAANKAPSQPVQPEQQLEISDDEQQVQLMPPHRIYLAKKLCEKNNFKNYIQTVLSRNESDKFGCKGDSNFIRSAALSLWGPSHLITHSVSGERCNGNKNKGVEAPLEALDKTEVEAIKVALKLRIAVERTLPAPKCAAGVPQATELERLRKVNHEIGQKISSLRKTAKGARIYRQCRQKLAQGCSS